MASKEKAVRQSVTLPAKVATQVRSMAKRRRLSANRMLIELVEEGLEAKQQKEKAFFELAERFRAARLACVASARCEAADRPSFFSARNVARERLADGFAEDPRRRSRLACVRVRGLT